MLKPAHCSTAGGITEGMTYSSLKLEESLCIVLAVPSWNLGFALHTKHYNSRGELRYGTLHGSGIGGITLSGTISPSCRSC